VRKISRTLFVQRDAIGVTDMIVWAARKPFLDKNRPAMVDFMETRPAYHPLVHRSQESERGHGDRRPHVTKQPPERYDWAVHKARRLSRSQHAAGLARGCKRNVDMTRDRRLVKRSSTCRSRPTSASRGSCEALK